MLWLCCFWDRGVFFAIGFLQGIIGLVDQFIQSGRFAPEHIPVGLRLLLQVAFYLPGQLPECLPHLAMLVNICVKPAGEHFRLRADLIKHGLLAQQFIHTLPPVAAVLHDPAGLNQCLNHAVTAKIGVHSLCFGKLWRGQP